MAVRRAMGEAGIPVLCYNFMPWSFRVGRTSYVTPVRGAWADLAGKASLPPAAHAACAGGSLSSEWRWEDFDDSIRTSEGETNHDDMWKNLEYFLKAVVPAAEKAGKTPRTRARGCLALHPSPFPPGGACGFLHVLVTIGAVLRRVLGVPPGRSAVSARPRSGPHLDVAGSL